MTFLGYIVLLVGVAGVALTRVPALRDAVPQVAALPVPTFVWAVVGVVGLIVVMATRRTRD